jgi:type VI protein secretion system component VasA
VRGATCTFRTVYPVTVAPLALTEAAFYPIIDHPEAVRLPDGAGSGLSLTLTATADQVRLGRLALPRLRKVKAVLEVRDENSVNRLRFSITALLVVSTSEETVNFDALLQPSTLQYSISKAGRASTAASAGA